MKNIADEGIEQFFQDDDASYRVMIENCPLAFIISRYGKVIYVNHACLHMFGYESSADVRGTSMFDHIAPEYRADVIDRVTRRFNGDDVPAKYETWGLKTDGSIFPFEVEVAMLDLSDGLATVAFITDITEFKNKENSLREAEAKWRSITENSPDHIIMLDRDFNVQFVNYPAPGLTKDQLLGKSLFNHVPPDYMEVTTKCLVDVLKTGDPGEFDVVYNGLNGEEIYYESRVGAIKNGNEIVALLIYSRNVTDRTLTELALEKSEKKYRELVNEAASIILRWDTSGRVTFFNEFAEKFFDYRQEEIIGKNVLGTIVPDKENSGRDLALLMDEIRKDPSKFEYNENENIKKSGERVWITWRNKPVYNERGELIEILSVGIDSTERKNAEDSIRKSQAELEAIINSLQDTYYRVNQEGYVIKVSPSVEQLLGFTPEEALKVRLSDLYVDPHGREKFLQTLVDNKGVITNYQAQLYRKDGSIIWVSTNAHFHFDDDGKVIGVEGSTRNITERMQFEEALQQSTAKFKAIYNAISDAVIFVNIHRQIVMINPAVTQIFGYTFEELENKTSGLLYASPQDYTRQGQFRFNIDSEPKQNLYEINYRRKDGAIFVGETFGTKIQDDQGNVIGFIGIIRDVNERKRIEERLRLSQKIFEDTAKAILVTDADKKIIDMNKAFYDITGFNKNDLIGKDFHLVQSKRHKKNFYKKLWDTLLTSDYWQGEVWNRKSNGEEYPNWATISTVKNEQGNANNYVAVFSDITAIKETEDRLEQLAHYDQLTGLPNRMLFHDHLHSAVARAKRHTHEIAVMYVDLDGFKQVNDTLGHAAGDSLLKNIAGLLKKCIRDEDTVARLGGDEFAIIINELQSQSYLRALAKRVVDEIFTVLSYQGRELRVSGSIGVSIYPNDGENETDLLRNADQAMYHAKKEGKNTYQFFNPEMNEKMLNRIHLESDLRKALKSDEIILHYQAKYNLQKKQVVGFEALVRWDHPERGTLQPVEFVPIAEDSDLIIELGKKVLLNACYHARRWYDAGRTSMPVAINISARQFKYENFVQDISDALKLSGLPAELLEIEITESLLMEDIEKTISKLKALKSMGLSISIDDFGIGYSSLNYLKKLPVDILKIDQSFVKDIAEDDDDRAIISAIISMANSLNLRVIAEGVENMQQLDFLNRKHCHEIQGFLLSHPVSFEFIDESIMVIEEKQLCVMD